MTQFLRYAAKSDVGMVRRDNEDSGYAGRTLLVVADGMGGHAAGELASSTAVATLLRITTTLTGHSVGAWLALGACSQPALVCCSVSSLPTACCRSSGRSGGIHMLCCCSPPPLPPHEPEPLTKVCRRRVCALLTAGTCSLLGVFMGVRASRSRKVFPAGLVAVLSLLMSVGYARTLF